MEKDIAVQVSREGNITMFVPETVNRLEHEKVNLLVSLLQRALDDSKQVQGYLKKIESITKPYNTHGQKVKIAVPIEENEVAGATPIIPAYTLLSLNGF